MAAILAEAGAIVGVIGVGVFVIEWAQAKYHSAAALGNRSSLAPFWCRSGPAFAPTLGTRLQHGNNYKSAPFRYRALPGGA